MELNKKLTYQYVTYLFNNLPKKCAETNLPCRDCEYDKLCAFFYRLLLVL